MSNLHENKINNAHRSCNLICVLFGLLHNKRFVAGTSLLQIKINLQTASRICADHIGARCVYILFRAEFHLQYNVEYRYEQDAYSRQGKKPGRTRTRFGNMIVHRNFLRVFLQISS